MLEVLSTLLRTTDDPSFKAGDRFKAAELLGKHYGLFDGKEEASRVSAAAAAALEALVHAVGEANA